MLKTMFPGIDRASSALGFGCMRLPTKEDGTIDEAQAIQMIRRGIDAGVLYVDTAYPYHGGESERLVGKALKDGYRERVILTTKLPCWKVEKHEDMMNLLDEQLEKLQTDHVDFYLLHALNAERYKKMKELGYKEFMDEALRLGKIRYPAFSFHDEHDVFMEILHDYPWKMCQVQMNILDGDKQAGLDGIREAGRLGIGVVIMEPLRGGLLADPPKEVREVYAAEKETRSPVEWAFRYLYTMPEIITILSGMSDMQQVEDNLRIFEKAERCDISEEEKHLYETVKETYLSRMKTKCTGCAYCQPCPRDVAIPKIFQGFDRSLLSEKGSFKGGYARIVEDKADASRCIACRKCERACPQHLPIVRYLQEIRAVCEG
ncbi:MAG: aldo/keto reductase [Clostridia bacterium]|nr:aldo/keto reductase [Clostridia bacterium]